MKQYPKAIAAFDKALALDPEYAKAHHGRGLAHVLVGDTAQSKQDLQTAAKLYGRQNNQVDYESVIRVLQKL